MKLFNSILALGLFSVALAVQRGSVGYTPQVNAGDRAFRDHEYQAAAAHYRSALIWDSKGVAAHVGLGHVYLKTGKTRRAIEEFEAALKYNLHSADAERGIHEARTEGEEQEAFQQLENLVIREPRNADIHTTYAEELLERDRVADARAQADLALQLDPKQWHAYSVIGQIALRNRDLKEARSNLEIAVKHDGMDDDSILAIGDLEFSEAHYSDALKYFRHLVRILPDESLGHSRLADVLAKLGEEKEAASERAIANAISKASEKGGGHS